ncbi:hypothetical protein NKJ72_09960 [Mesorhizobium sp. M0045]|uniref:hypothetical protein n=1 Tax=Mesorhizobium sp. M0045 TaxID=2956857 RepID=UPI003335BA98
MAGLELTIDELLLDLENPRISRCESQREALQKVIEDQDVKLVVLAESIVSDGLNPMDRWLVLKSPLELGKYIVLEGNRRLATIRVLNNRHLLSSLEVRSAIKKRLEDLADQFDLDRTQPIACFEIGDRPSAAAWLNQRHTGENKGRGIVNWGGVATARFRGRDPALQALDLVLEHGELSDEEKALVEDHFPISTLDRLLSTPAVRNLIGVDVSESKLKTDLPPAEVIKPIRRIVLDLANEVINVSALKNRDQMVGYANKLGKDLPNLSKRTGELKSVDELGDRDFKPPPAPKPKPKPRPVPLRKTLIPRDCYLTVSNPKIAEIAKELRNLTIADFPHAISVLFRVFLEQSVDHYLTQQGIPLQVSTTGGNKDKNLRKKVGEAIEGIVAAGTPKKDLAGVEKGIDDKDSPLFVDTLHNYEHNRFYSPTERDLKVAWDNAQLFFEKIWQ